MNKIPSFTVDHIKLQKGVYISRKDAVGENIITTYDLRWKKPNEEPVLNTAEIHAIEHLAATFLRNDEANKDDVIYFGPMGCRTGFYLILKGEKEPKDILPLLMDTMNFIISFEGQIPGASAKDCGNFLDMNLPMAKYETQKYLDILESITDSQLVYPE